MKCSLVRLMCASIGFWAYLWDALWCREGSSAAGEGAKVTHGHITHAYRSASIGTLTLFDQTGCAAR